MHLFMTILGYVAAGLLVLAFVKHRVRKTREQWRRTKSKYAGSK